MKKLFLLVPVLALVVSCGQEVPADGEFGPYTVTTLAKNVYHIEDCNSSNPSGMSVKPDGGFNMNNCSDMYLVVGKKKALLIDLSNNIRWADNAPESLRQIFYDRAGEREKIIAITHNHGDHTGMLPAFAEEQDVNFLLQRADFEKSKAFPAERVTFYDEGEKIDLGGYKISTVMVPGHTAGSMVFFLDGMNMAFSGDAIGSGGGVWLFAPQSLEQYAQGVDHLIAYMEDPANGIDTESLTFFGGHDWQKANGKIEKLDAQYVYDMQTLCSQIKAGEASWEPYNAGNRMLNANFRYGSATITWNSDSAKELYGQE